MSFLFFCRESQAGESHEMIGVVENVNFQHLEKLVSQDLSCYETNNEITLGLKCSLSGDL